MGKMANWKEFNRWEDERQREELPKLTVEESFRQFCELWKFSMLLARAGDNHEYLSNVATNPHLQELVAWKQMLEKAKGIC